MLVNEKKAKSALNKKMNKAEATIKSERKAEDFIRKADKKLEHSKLKKGLDYIPTMIQLIKSYIKKEYSEIPLGTILAILAALIYWVAPIDIIPDFVPFAGYIDDGAVVTACLTMVKSDLDEFKAWCSINKGNTSL